MTYFKSHSFCIAHKVSGNTWWKKKSLQKRANTHQFKKLPAYLQRYIQSVLELFGFVNNFLEHMRNNAVSIHG